MVRVEVHEYEVATEMDGNILDVCTEAVIAINGIYQQIARKHPDVKRTLWHVIMKGIADGNLFSDSEESIGEIIDDIPTTATKNSALMPET